MQPSHAQALDALYATGHWLFTEKRYADAIRVFHALLFSAPTDERGWLAVGACHEALGNDGVAYAVYDAGRRAAPAPVRCEIARARVARALGSDAISDAAYEHAAVVAENSGDENLINLVAQERSAP
jgi:hypothetical protein